MSARRSAPTSAAAGALIRDAAARGATLIALPEVADAIIEDPALLQERAQPEERHEALAGYRALARETGTALLLGSAVVRTGGPRFANRSYLLGPDGAVLARYDKIHLYDADLPDGEVHRESAQFAPGGTGVVARLPGGGGLGLTICYDLRFPQLHRALAGRRSWRCRPPSPAPPAPRCCCGPGRSRPAAVLARPDRRIWARCCCGARAMPRPRSVLLAWPPRRPRRCTLIIPAAEVRSLRRAADVS